MFRFRHCNIFARRTTSTSTSYSLLATGMHRCKNAGAAYKQLFDQEMKLMLLADGAAHGDARTSVDHLPSVWVSPKYSPAGIV